MPTTGSRLHCNINSFANLSYFSENMKPYPPNTVDPCKLSGFAGELVLYLLLAEYGLCVEPTPLAKEPFLNHLTLLLSKIYGKAWVPLECSQEPRLTFQVSR